MRRLTNSVITFCLCFCATAAAEERKDRSWTFSFLFENDLFGDTDRNYTNGVKLTWVSPDLTHYKDSGKLPDWSLPLIHRLPFINEPGLQRNVAFSVGQKIFTPEEIERRDLITDDRPYAGWLFFATAFHNKNVKRLDTIEVELGVVGPAALAEEAQNFVHETRGIAKAEGWDHQLENEPGVALIYERKWRVAEAHHASGWGFDVIAHAGGALGNVYTYGNGGAELRLGWNIPVDFGSSLIRPGGDNSAPADSSDPRFLMQGKYSVHAFAGVSGRAILRDIFLDGNTVADSHSVDKENFVGDILLGASAIFGNVKLSYAQVLRSKEFEGQDSGHNFGSVSLSYSY